MSSNVVSLADRRDIATLAANDNSREHAILRAWNAYNGKWQPALVTKPGRVDDNVYVNFCRLIVDKGVAFLFGKEIEFSVDAGEDDAGLKAESPDEKWLKDAWEYNKKSIILQKLAKNGAIAGHAFMKIINDPTLPFPRLVPLDSSKVCVETEEDDVDKVWEYTIKWTVYDKEYDRIKHRRQRVVQDVNELGWWIIDEVSYENANFSYSPTTNPDGTMSGVIRKWEELSREQWPYPFAPIVDNQNLPTSNSFWGTSDLEEDIIIINEAINRTLSNTNRMIRVHAWPRMWTTGLTNEQIKQIRVDSDGIIHFPGQNGTLNVVQVSGDVAAAIDFYTRLRESLHELSRIPEVATGKMEGIGELSGAALQILYGPIAEKNAEKRLTYGWNIKETSRRMRAITSGNLLVIPDINWPEVLPKDAYTEAQTMVMLQQAGVSIHTTLEEAGYDAEKEADLRDVEAEIAAERMIETQQAMMGGAQESDNAIPANNDDNDEE